MQTIEKNSIRDYSNTDYEVFNLDHTKQHNELKPAWGYNFKYLLVGICFGIVLVKSEVVSWFRIQEMFRFQSFKMYGIIGSAIIVGIISILIIKKFKIRSVEGEIIELPERRFQLGQVYGGLMFGFGWAITGACPGPIFAQIGAGATVVIITLMSAIAGTWVYGWLRDKLPH